MLGIDGPKEDDRIGMEEAIEGEMEDDKVGLMNSLEETLIGSENVVRLLL